MPAAIAQWTDQQWGVFMATLAAGLLAAVLAPVVVRVRADLRQAHALTRARAFAGHWPAAAEVLPADVIEHVAAGPGSLTTLREVGPGSIAPVEPLVDPDVSAEIGAALDAALEAFRVAVEPSMRKARLWTLQAGESYAVNALRTWRMMSDTGAYPIVASGVLDGARA